MVEMAITRHADILGPIPHGGAQCVRKIVRF